MHILSNLYFKISHSISSHKLTQFVHIMASYNPDTDNPNIDSFLTLTSLTPGDYDTSIMFVGTVGVGKSTLCNFLSRREIFDTAGSAFSKTKKASSYIFPVEDHRCLIIDCPGFRETQEINEKEVVGW